MSKSVKHLAVHCVQLVRSRAGAHERLGQPDAHEGGSGPDSLLESRERIVSEGSALLELPQAAGNAPSRLLLFAAITLSAGNAPGLPHDPGSLPAHKSLPLGSSLPASCSNAAYVKCFSSGRLSQL